MNSKNPKQTAPNATYVASAALAILFAVGCRDEYPAAPVSGVVTLDGKPLTGAKIGFEPIRDGGSTLVGPGAYGKTNGEGRYELKTLLGDDGATIGRNRVWIRTYRAGGSEEGGFSPPARKEEVPLRYNERSELVFEVPPKGAEDADFELVTSTNKKRRR